MSLREAELLLFCFVFSPFFKVGNFRLLYIAHDSIITVFAVIECIYKSIFGLGKFLWVVRKTGVMRRVGLSSIVSNLYG